MIVITSQQLHLARVKQLRKLGYRVKMITLPNGDRLVLTSKRRFVCRAHHCLARNERDARPASAVPWPKKPTKKSKARR